MTTENSTNTPMETLDDSIHMHCFSRSSFLSGKRLVPMLQNIFITTLKFFLLSRGKSKYDYDKAVNDESQVNTHLYDHTVVLFVSSNSADDWRVFIFPTSFFNNIIRISLSLFCWCGTFVCSRYLRKMLSVSSSSVKNKIFY